MRPLRFLLRMIFFDIECQSLPQRLALVHCAVIDADQCPHFVKQIGAIRVTANAEADRVHAWKDGAIAGHLGDEGFEFAFGHGGGRVV